MEMFGKNEQLYRSFEHFEAQTQIHCGKLMGGVHTYRNSDAQGAHICVSVVLAEMPSDHHWPVLSRV